MNKMLIYSAFSANYYEIPESDYSLLDPGQLPLTKYPKRNCNKCHGRGHLGKDKQTCTYVICNCIKKVINVDLIKKTETQIIK